MNRRPTMQYRRFGRTGLSMPVLSCGGMRFQHQWQDTPFEEVPRANQDNLEATVRRAFDLGIHHFETARGYGTSEMQLGRILPTLPRKEIIVQTKVAPTADPRDFLETFHRSLRLLKLDYVDLLALHGINDRTFLDWSTRKGGCLEAARELQRQGLVRHVGFSTHATTDIILEAVRGDGFDFLNVHWYFVNDLNWPAIAEAQRRDMGVFIISPNDKGGKLYEPPPKLTELCSPLTPMQFNQLYCLSRPEVHTLSCGAARPEDFDEHIEGLKHYANIEKVLAPIERRVRAAMEKALGADWCRSWHEGVPEYVDLPGQINAKEILRLWTYAKSLDMVGWGRMRYNLLGQGDHWFPGENAAEAGRRLRPEHFPDSPFRGTIPGLLQEAHRLLFEKPVSRLSQS